MALLLETITEEFPRESCECDIIIIIVIMAPFLIVVCRPSWNIKAEIRPAGIVVAAEVVVALTWDKPLSVAAIMS